MLSIVIPTYNEHKMLPILLESIKQQSYTDYEIIVADNNSTDNTVEIAKSYGCKIVSGGMPGAGRNAGANAISDQYNTILFLDSDVVLPYEDFLKDSLKEYHARYLTLATCKIVPLSDKLFDKFLHGFYNVSIKVLSAFEAQAPGYCIFVDSGVHRMIGGFDEEIKLGEDSDYTVRAGKYSVFGILKTPIFVSVRRLERDGRLNILVKYTLSGLYMKIFGKIKTDIFKYTFGHK